MYVNKTNPSPSSSLNMNSNLKSSTSKPAGAQKNPLDSTPVKLNEKNAIDEKEEDIDEDENYSDDYSEADKSESKSKTETPVVKTPPKNEETKPAEVKAPSPVV